MALFFFNPSNWEAEAREFLGVQSQFGLQSETLERQREGGGVKVQKNLKCVRPTLYSYFAMSSPFVSKFDCTLALGFSNTVLFGWLFLFCCLFVCLLQDLYMKPRLAFNL